MIHESSGHIPPLFVLHHVVFLSFCLCLCFCFQTITYQFLFSSNENIMRTDAEIVLHPLHTDYYSNWFNETVKHWAAQSICILVDFSPIRFIQRMTINAHRMHTTIPSHDAIQYEICDFMFDFVFIWHSNLFYLRKLRDKEKNHNNNSSSSNVNVLCLVTTSSSSKVKQDKTYQTWSNWIGFTKKRQSEREREKNDPNQTKQINKQKYKTITIYGWYFYVMKIGAVHTDARIRMWHFKWMS